MQDLQVELNHHRQSLNYAIKELKERGNNKAKAERDYRVALASKMLELRTEGIPVTIMSDLCRGDKDIAQLKMERDIADTLYDSNMQFIYSTKLNIDIIVNQINNEIKGV